MDEKELKWKRELTIDQAADLLDRDPKEVEVLCVRGEIPARRSARGLVRIPARDLGDYIRGKGK